MSEAILETRRLCAGYGKKQIVNGISLSLHKGEVLLVLGHNGAGKTTYVRSVFGLLPPASGKVLYEGQEITGRKPAGNVTDGIRSEERRVGEERRSRRWTEPDI